MRTVLIVEDDGLVARQMARAVRRAGHHPLLAATGFAAVREAAADPDLVLLDLGLPDVHGAQVLDLLRQAPSTSDIPVLVVTGRTEDAAQLQARHPADLAGVLLKPVDTSVLTEAMQRIFSAPGPMRQAAARDVGEFRRREVIRRLIVDGPDRLAGHVYRRLCADRPATPEGGTADVLGWPEIAAWAKLEGLVGDEEVQLLCNAVEMSATGAEEPAAGSGHRHGKRRDGAEAREAP